MPQPCPPADRAALPGCALPAADDWQRLWRHAGIGRPSAAGLRVRALQADHPGLPQALSALRPAELRLANALGELRVQRGAVARLQPAGPAAWAWAFAAERPAAGTGGGRRRSLHQFDARRQPALQLDFAPCDDATAFYDLVEDHGALALRPAASVGVDAGGSSGAPTRLGRGARALPPGAWLDLLARAAQAGLTLDLRAPAAGCDLRLALRPERLCAGQGHLRLDADAAHWRLHEAALAALWWQPGRHPEDAASLLALDARGQLLAELHGARAGQGACTWRALLAEALADAAPDAGLPTVPSVPRMPPPATHATPSLA